MDREELISPQAAADRLNVKRSTLERMRREGRGPAWIKISGEVGRPGGQVRYLPSDIDDYLQSRRVQPERQAGPMIWDIPLPGLENGEIGGGIVGEELPLDPT